MYDPDLLQLWSQVAIYSKTRCGAMYMADSLVEQMKSPISALTCYYTQPSSITLSLSPSSPLSSNMAILHLVGGDADGNVIIFDEHYNVLINTNLHRHSKVTAMSTTYKHRPVRYISTGGEDGSVSIINLKEKTIEYLLVVGVYNPFIIIMFIILFIIDSISRQVANYE